MSDKIYYTLILAVLIAGCISTAALAVYTRGLYENSSIVSYVASGR